jgi:hypothetical protein
MAPMPAPGLSLLLAMLAPAASATSASPPDPQKVYGPEAAVAPKPAPTPPANPEQRDCTNTSKDPNGPEIVICAPRPQGYRLNPDVLEAKREMRSGGPPKSQQQRMQVQDNCAVGPAGCQYAGINLLAAAVTAATMATRLAKGQEIGSMFQTDPHPDEYHLYLAAKARREAKEAEAKAKAVAAAAKQAQAAAPAAQAQSTPTQPSSAGQR